MWSKLLVDYEGMNNSLFAASAADLTIERIRALATRLDQVESLTLEYKSEYSASLVTTIAAMANTYGGMILVGINDRVEPGVERVVGVDGQATIDQIVSGCSTMLDPPWEPTFFNVPFGDGSGRSVVVVRVDANVAPRPVLIKVKAPIRLSGRNATADRARLLQLAREEPSATVLPTGQNVMSPNLDRDGEGKATADFILRTGINLPMGEAAAWRPLSEKTVAALAQALNGSALPPVLHTSETGRSTMPRTSVSSGTTEPGRPGWFGRPPAGPPRISTWSRRSCRWSSPRSTALRRRLRPRASPSTSSPGSASTLKAEATQGGHIGTRCPTWPSCSKGC
ncbi:ATP-binding protein [Streptomyces sp. NPDC026589]|uniref:AlbA family DNA-binding domain-containing protein n=1 Tax=Streptomyces sp. NPDC026589 TaxID=3155609 RepID=UPI0033C4EFBF